MVGLVPARRTSKPETRREASSPTKTRKETPHEEQEHPATSSHARRQTQTKKPQPKQEDESQQAATAAPADRDRGQTPANPTNQSHDYVYYNLCEIDIKSLLHCEFFTQRFLRSIF